MAAGRAHRAGYAQTAARCPKRHGHVHACSCRPPDARSSCTAGMAQSSANRQVRRAGLQAQQPPAGGVCVQHGAAVEVDQQGRTVTIGQILLRGAGCGALGSLSHARYVGESAARFCLPGTYRRASIARPPADTSSCSERKNALALDAWDIVHPGSDRPCTWRQKHQRFPMTDKPAMEIPPAMREMAERSVEQARSAYQQFMDMAHQAQDMVAKSSDAVTSSAKEVQARALRYAQENMDSSFTFASDLATRARSEGVSGDPAALRAEAGHDLYPAGPGARPPDGRRRPDGAAQDVTCHPGPCARDPSISLLHLRGSAAFR